MKFEKRPGYDWFVTYDVGEGEQTMTVFGAMTIDQAIADARSSFRLDEPTITAAVRRQGTE